MDNINSVREIERIKNEACVDVARLYGARVSDIQRIRSGNLEKLLRELGAVEFRTTTGSLVPNEVLYNAEESAHSAWIRAKKKGWSDYEAKVNAMQAYKSTMSLYHYYGNVGLDMLSISFDMFM